MLKKEIVYNDIFILYSRNIWSIQQVLYKMIAENKALFSYMCKKKIKIFLW